MKGQGELCLPFLRKEADSVDRKIDAMGERAREEEAAKTVVEERIS